MPFEDPKFISDLVITNPTSADLRSAGDEHLRALRLVLIGDGTDQAGSFTSNFTGQYTGTAAELQSIRDQIIPDPLPEDGDLLVWDTDKFVPQPNVAAIYEAAYTGYAGIAGAADEVYFTTEAYNTVPVELATIDNPRGGGGWFLKAVKKCKVDLHFTAQVERTGATLNTGNPSILRNVDGVAYTLSTAKNQFDNDGGPVFGASTLSASVVLDVDETLSCTWPAVAGTRTAMNNVTVQEAA